MDLPKTEYKLPFVLRKRKRLKLKYVNKTERLKQNILKDYVGRKFEFLPIHLHNFMDNIQSFLESLKL